MKPTPVIRRRLISVLGNIALALLGLGMALGLMEFLLRTYPNLVPRDVRVDPPVRRIPTSNSQTYDVKLSSGDLYYWMRGSIAPVPPDQDTVLAQVHLTTDANGFRNSLSESARYDIVALGDSFTVGGNVASPWPQMLAEFSESSVLNLGEAGDGPQQELEILRRYGLAPSPRWVILAYFEGNDLYDAASYAQASPFILPRFGKYIVERGLEALSESRSASAEAIIKPSYRYPIEVTVGGTDLGMAFFSYYISWLSVNSEAIESSQNYRLVGESILKMRELSESEEARFLLVYVPSKEHVYLPYLNDADLLEPVFTDVPTLELDGAGFLQFTSESATPELTRQHMDDQVNLWADFAAGQNIFFLDLTSTFQEEAGIGAELYYPFDTHWNQSGHDLAAQTIAQYIENISMP